MRPSIELYVLVLGLRCPGVHTPAAKHAHDCCQARTPGIAARGAHGAHLPHSLEGSKPFTHEPWCPRL